MNKSLFSAPCQTLKNKHRIFFTHNGGSRRGAPSIFRPNGGLKGRKKVFLRSAPPPYLRVWMTPPPPSPPSERNVTGFFTGTYHRATHSHFSRTVFSNWKKEIFQFRTCNSEIMERNVTALFRGNFSSWRFDSSQIFNVTIFTRQSYAHKLVES